MEEMIRKQVYIEPRQERPLKCGGGRAMSSTRVDVLVDANVFVYTYVTAEPEKRARALDALDRLAGDAFNDRTRSSGPRRA